MSYNPIIRGLNAVSKFITRGYAAIGGIGTNVKICRVWTGRYIGMNVKTDNFICQKLSTKNYIDMKVSTV